MVGSQPIKNPDRNAEMLFLPSTLFFSLLVGSSDDELVRQFVRSRLSLLGFADIDAAS